MSTEELEVDGFPWFIVTTFVLTLVYAVYFYFLTPRQAVAHTAIYSRPRWNFYFKQLWVWFAIKRYRLRRRKAKPPVVSVVIPTAEDIELEKPHLTRSDRESDGFKIIGVDQKGNSIILRIGKYSRRNELWLQLRLANGDLYTLPDADCKIATPCQTNDEEWECGGLKIQVLHPMLRLRVTFNGLLQNTADDGTASLQHVHFSFIWTASGSIINIIDDWNAQLLSEAFAREPWKRKEWFYQVNDQGLGFDQWGALVGQLFVNEEKHELYFTSIRQRRWGVSAAEIFHRRVTITGVTHTGTSFMIRATCNPLGLTHAKFGYVRTANTLQHMVNQCDVSLPHLAEYQSSPIPKAMTLTFTANKQCFRTNIHLNHSIPLKHIRSNQYISKINPASCIINGDAGYALVEFWYSLNKEVIQPSPIIKPLKTILTMKTPLVLPLTDELCSLEPLTGGKGSSLSKLALSKKSEFEVSPGFCVTVHGLDKHLASHPDILQRIKDFKGISQDRLQNHCEEVVKLLERAPVEKVLANEITLELEKLGDVSVAVRSSAIGEDSEDMSAAGQNITLLGVKGKENVLEAVRQCWASLYAFRSVEYRRQHGQKVECCMCVVVQRMVVADKAGVMFTRNPVTGDPRQIELSANYGLGETVVSADVDPDRVVVFKEADGQLKITQAECGSKSHKIILTESGTKKEEIKENNKMCLSNDDILNLAGLASLLENIFDNKALDVEWAISNGKVYMLQARPITTLNQWTEYDLLHEMDSALNPENELITFGNTEEVLPGVGSTLMFSIITPLMVAGMKVDLGCPVNVTHNRLVINLLNTFLMEPEEEFDTLNFKITQVAILGHASVTREMHEIAKRRNGVASSIKKLLRFAEIGKVALTAGKLIRDTTNFINNSFNLHVEDYNDCKTLHQHLLNSMHVLSDIGTVHGYASQLSMMYEIFTAIAIAEGNNDLTSEHLSDISLVLSSCTDVLSAEIPFSMKKISLLVVKCPNAEEFTKIDPQDGMEWLKHNHAAAYQDLITFLNKHGHRGYKEFDFISEVWAVDNPKLIKSLQDLVRGQLTKLDAETEGKREPLTVEQIINKMVSPKKPFTKKLLKFFIPLCQKGVSNREATKGAYIKAVHQFRLGIRRLGQLMVQEEFLPSSDLIFHLTYYEIKVLLDTRDASLVMKAYRRQRFYPQWGKMKFAEMQIGLPRPLEPKLPTSNGLYKCQGTPVYPGTILARACVILDISEISELQKGDILITHSTDVGWSPYFPMLSGIVTELGGLISHGAVVAREYGLPCVIGVDDAVTTFKTGDMVLLSGSTGTIERIDSLDSLDG